MGEGFEADIPACSGQKAEKHGAFGGGLCLQCSHWRSIWMVTDVRDLFMSKWYLLLLSKDAFCFLKNIISDIWPNNRGPFSNLWTLLFHKLGGIKLSAVLTSLTQNYNQEADINSVPTWSLVIYSLYYITWPHPGRISALDMQKWNWYPSSHLTQSTSTNKDHFQNVGPFL